MQDQSIQDRNIIKDNMIHKLGKTRESTKHKKPDISEYILQELREDKEVLED